MGPFFYCFLQSCIPKDLNTFLSILRCGFSPLLLEKAPLCTSLIDTSIALYYISLLYLDLETGYDEYRNPNDSTEIIYVPRIEKSPNFEKYLNKEQTGELLICHS